MGGREKDGREGKSGDRTGRRGEWEEGERVKDGMGERVEEGETDWRGLGWREDRIKWQEKERSLQDDGHLGKSGENEDALLGRIKLSPYY